MIYSGFSHEKWWIFPSFFVCLPEANATEGLCYPGHRLQEVNGAIFSPRNHGISAWIAVPEIGAKTGPNASHMFTSLQAESVNCIELY